MNTFTGPSLEPPSLRPGNWSASCPSVLEDYRVQHRDLLTDLARLDEMLLGIAPHNLGAEDTQARVDRIRRFLSIVTDEAREMPRAEEVDCDWSGDVDADFQRLGAGAGTAYWTCPRCGAEHADEFDRSDYED